MHRQLAGFDPITAARLAPNDSQRIQRAIEIYRITRKPMSELLAQRPKQQNENYRYVTISLEPSDRLALHARIRSEEHTSELQSLMRISYAVFCLKKKKTQKINTNTSINTKQSSQIKIIMN